MCLENDSVGQAVNGLVDSFNEPILKLCILIIFMMCLLIRQRDLSGSNLKMKTIPLILN